MGYNSTQVMDIKRARLCLKNNFCKKVLSYLTIISLFVNSILPYGLVVAAYAQELTPTEIPTSVPTSIPDLTPTIDLTPTPTVLPTIEPTPEATPTALPAVIVEPTIKPTPEATSTAVIEVTTPIVTRNINFVPTKIINQEKNPLRVVGDFQKNSKKQTNKDYVEGEVIVKFKKDKLDVKSLFGKAQAFVFEKKYSLEKFDEIRNSNIKVFKSKKSTSDLVKELKDDSNVEYAEPNYIRYPATISSNDTSKSLLWGLDNTGQSVNGTTGTNDADIDAPEAWGLSEGSSNVIVAIIDSGVAYNHPDLLANMWDGTNCKDENGVFLGGCNYGYDYESNDKIPLPDDSSHGTHIAGTIAAVKNNSKGIIGVAPNTKIMALKYDFNVASEVKAIDFAIQNGAKVINASFTGNDYSQSEYDAINRFKNASGIFVAVAGNESVNNNGGIPSYPSDYDLDNIISVAATSQNDSLASFSNYGVTSVDVGAPGTSIYSTVSSDTVVLNETFESMVVSNVPIGWVKSGTGNNWGTHDLGGAWGNVLYGDLDYPYANNINTTIDSTTYDLTLGGASIDFWTGCDTEYITNGWADYMQLEYSSDGTNFLPAIDLYTGQEFRWDEPTLDILNGDSLNSTGSSVFHYENVPIPSQYLTSNFKFRFRWVTNSTDNSYNGCLVDDVKIIKFSDGSDEQYGYMDGTSMAAPHVTGLVALMWGVKPDLTASQIKTTILNTGDAISSLSGKTVSGKRINAYNAMDRIINSDDPVFRFWNKIDGRHFFTMSEVEKNQIINTLSDTWTYEGIAYDSLEYELFDSVPLFRFWNKIYGNHFYTTSVFEKDGLIANNFNTWTYEGIAYYVYPLGSTTGTTEVFRFWNKINGRHFYTTSVIEKDGLIANNSDVWNYEGLAWKVSD